ncbi:MAG: hypothetical protein IPK82_30435 [Polyangiaceae bacterium]|nr:hypothetical protein [Polyangiaceae bacterium]
MMKATRILGFAFLLATASCFFGGCEDRKVTPAEVCEALCDCLTSCDDTGITTCEAEFAKAAQLAEAADCADEYNRYLLCLVEQVKCGQSSTFEKCNEPAGAYGTCVNE